MYTHKLGTLELHHPSRLVFESCRTDKGADKATFFWHPPASSPTRSLLVLACTFDFGIT